MSKYTFSSLSRCASLCAEEKRIWIWNLLQFFFRTISCLVDYTDYPSSIMTTTHFHHSSSPHGFFFVISTDERILRNDLNDFCEVYFVEWWNDFATFSFNIVKSHRTVCGQKPYIVTFLFTEITLRWLCKFKNISSSLTQKVFRRDRTLSLPTCTD